MEYYNFLKNLLEGCPLLEDVLREGETAKI